MMLVALVSATFTSCSKDDSDPAMVGSWMYTKTDVQSSYTENDTWNLELKEDGTGTLNRIGQYSTTGTGGTTISWNISYNLIYTYDPEKNDRYGNYRVSVVSRIPEKIDNTVQSHLTGTIWDQNDMKTGSFSVAGDKLHIFGLVFSKK